jgi:hypothetical protein
MDLLTISALIVGTTAIGLSIYQINVDDDQESTGDPGMEVFPEVLKPAGDVEEFVLLSESETQQYADRTAPGSATHALGAAYVIDPEVGVDSGVLMVTV